MTCSKCNFQNEEPAKYCKNCGAKLSIKDQSAPESKKKNKFFWVMISSFILLIAVASFVVWKYYFSQSQADNDLAKFNLKGDVSSIDQRTYLVNDESDELNSKNELDLNNYMRYSYKGLDINFLWLRYLSCFQIEFSESGQITKVTVTANSSPIEIIYKYDNDGRRLVEILINDKGALTVKLQYNDKDQLIQENWFDKFNFKFASVIYELDSKGNPILQTENFENDDIKISKTSYEYDESGMIIVINYNEKHAHLFTEKGNGYTTTQSNLRFSYDNKGNILKLENNYYKEMDNSELPPENGMVWANSSSNLSTVWSYEYQYDENGNWIKRIERGTVKNVYGMDPPQDNKYEYPYYPKEGMTITLVTTRKIEYY